MSNPKDYLDWAQRFHPRGGGHTTSPPGPVVPPPLQAIPQLPPPPPGYGWAMTQAGWTLVPLMAPSAPMVHAATAPTYAAPPQPQFYSAVPGMPAVVPARDPRESCKLVKPGAPNDWDMKMGTVPDLSAPSDQAAVAQALMEAGLSNAAPDESAYPTQGRGAPSATAAPLGSVALPDQK